MDRGQQRPLSVDDAKRRLLRAGDEIGPGAIVRHHSALAWMLAFGTGVLLARSPTLRQRALAVFGMTLGGYRVPLALLPAALHILFRKRHKISQEQR